MADGLEIYQRITPEAVALFHEKSDKDSSVYALHHTLGLNPEQAAQGSHIHDGRSGKLLNGANVPSVVSGSRSGNAAVASLLAQLAAMRIITDSTTP